HLPQLRRVFRAKSVTHAIETREIRRGFGSGDDVINRDCITSAGQFDVYNLDTQIAIYIDISLDRVLHFVVETLAKQRAWETEARAFQIAREVCGVIRDGNVRCR